MAVRGEFSWPSAGNSGGRPRGILMAAYGEIAMAVDTVVNTKTTKPRHATRYLVDVLHPEEPRGLAR